MPQSTPTIDIIATHLAQMFELVDHRDTVATLEFCTDDFVMSALGLEFARPQYDELMTARADAAYDTRHTFTNLWITDESETTAVAHFLVTVHRRDHSDGLISLSVADFVDEWRRDGGQWRLATRSIEPAIDSRPEDRQGL